MQEEHPEMSICEPLAPRGFMVVGHRTPTGAPASLNVSKKERDTAVTAEPESTSGHQSTLPGTSDPHLISA